MIRSTAYLLFVCALFVAAEADTCEKSRKYLDTCDCKCEYPKSFDVVEGAECPAVQALACPMLENCCEDCYPYLEMYLDTCIFSDGCSCESWAGQCDPDDEDCKAEQNQNTFKSKYGTTDVIWLNIEEVQGDVPFGNLLDAGTGRGSLTWLSRVNTTSLTAVTAAEGMKIETLRTAEEVGVTDLNIVLGNWFGEEPVVFEQKFDTILADYLIGAVSGFSDYYQEEVIPKLVDHLKPGGYLYIIGWEPIPNSGLYADQHIISEMKLVRDAAIMLAGELYYREYPLSWIQRQASKLPHCTLTNATSYPIWYGMEKIISQLDVARQKLPKLGSKKLARALREYVDDIEEEAQYATARNYGRIVQGFDYVVAIRKDRELTAEEA